MSQEQPKQPKQSFWVTLRILVVNLTVWWKTALEKIRTRLPESVNQKLPNDTLLTGAIAALFILLFWAISILLPGKPPQIAEVPPPLVSAPPAQSLPSETEATLPPAIEAPPELTAPSSPKLVEIVPPPVPVLTPEENLIAAIQNRVTEIIKEYADGSIESIEANFQGSLLTVKVGDDWYNFDESKQDKLVADMWNRSRGFDFSKLEITDDRGTPIARSPIVGSNMVILKR